MTSGKYFNRAVIALDTPHVGYVVRETNDKIVVFGDGKERYDIPLSEIQTVSKNVLIGLNFDEIVKKYSVDRDAPLPTSKYVDPWGADGTTDLKSYMKEYAKTLFNKGVRLANEDHVGHVMKETSNKIVVFGYGNERFDIPKSEILAVGRNIITKKNFPELFSFKVDRNSPLPTGEPLEKIDEEAYPEYYHGPRDDEKGKQDLMYPK